MALAGWNAAVPAIRKWVVGGSNGFADTTDVTRVALPLSRSSRCASRIHQKDAHDAGRRSRFGAQTTAGVKVMSKMPNKRKTRKSHMGSSIDDFMKREGIFEESQAQAVKEVVAWQLDEAMKKQKISKNKMATLLKTSRTQVDRILNPKNDITLSSLQRAAAIVGRRVTIELV
jgi:plasmid maintenance system antidote protein VapI